MVSPKKGSLFSRVTEHLRYRTVASLGWSLHPSGPSPFSLSQEPESFQASGAALGARVDTGAFPTSPGCVFVLGEPPNLIAIGFNCSIEIRGVPSNPQSVKTFRRGVNKQSKMALFILVFL